ncbi:hypothetical protein [Marinobacter alexandrii]|uniref:hypothetical protein n=1 Tax=Marinobacter alexandrii TaxID=2570351 RepID=UPI0032980824
MAPNDYAAGDSTADGDRVGDIPVGVYAAGGIPADDVPEVSDGLLGDGPYLVDVDRYPAV